MSTRPGHLKRNFLSTGDIARLSHRSRAQISSLAKAGKIPGQRVNRQKPYRYFDSPEIRKWCEVNRKRLSRIERLHAFIPAIVSAVIERDYRADPDRFILREIDSQLCESQDPDRLLEKWERARGDRHTEDLPRIDLAHAGREILAQICRQLVDSKNPEQLLKKWARALWDQRFDDLPHIP
jgi:hypothetical protein